MSAITVEKGDFLAPSIEMNSFIPEQFVFRKTKEFLGTNRIAILRMNESAWWNRPLESDVMVKQEPDGLYSYNLPFLGAVDTYKANYNLLLPIDGIAIISHIKFDEEDSEQFRWKVYELSYQVLYDSLVELGVSEEHLTQIRNDTLYDGKKFAGGEKKTIDDSVFTEDMIITTHFKVVEDIFSRLTGTYAQARGITGIIDEEPWLTVDMIIDKLYEKFNQELFEEAR